MGHQWRISFLLYVGIVLLFESKLCYAKSKASTKASAHTLALKTGAAHYEEHFEASVEDSNEHNLKKRQSDEDLDYEVYQGVVGRAGIDFPIFARIPQTTFSCRSFGNGYFADLETECQVFHICEAGRKISFLCPNGTIFQQDELICDWWFKVNCAASPGRYAESSEMLARQRDRQRQNRPRIEVSYQPQRDSVGYQGPKTTIKNQYFSNNENRFDFNNGKKSTGGAVQGGKLHRRIDSDEEPSQENFDFEDISDATTTRYRGRNEKIIKSQDSAESTSFGSNEKRKNGLNYEGFSKSKTRNQNTNDEPVDDYRTPQVIEGTKRGSYRPAFKNSQRVQSNRNEAEYSNSRGQHHDSDQTKFRGSFDALNDASHQSGSAEVNAADDRGQRKELGSSGSQGSSSGGHLDNKNLGHHDSEFDSFERVNGHQGVLVLRSQHAGKNLGAQNQQSYRKTNGNSDIQNSVSTTHSDGSDASGKSKNAERISSTKNSPSSEYNARSQETYHNGGLSSFPKTANSISSGTRNLGQLENSDGEVENSVGFSKSTSLNLSATKGNSVGFSSSGQGKISAGTTAQRFGNPQVSNVSGLIGSEISKDNNGSEKSGNSKNSGSYEGFTGSSGIEESKSSVSGKVNRRLEIGLENLSITTSHSGEIRNVNSRQSVNSNVSGQTEISNNGITSGYSGISENQTPQTFTTISDSSTASSIGDLGKIRISGTSQFFGNTGSLNVDNSRYGSNSEQNRNSSNTFGRLVSTSQSQRPPTNAGNVEFGTRMVVSVSHSSSSANSIDNSDNPPKSQVVSTVNSKTTNGFSDFEVLGRSDVNSQNGGRKVSRYTEQSTGNYNQLANGKTSISESRGLSGNIQSKNSQQNQNNVGRQGYTYSAPTTGKESSQQSSKPDRGNQKYNMSPSRQERKHDVVPSLIHERIIESTGQPSTSTTRPGTYTTARKLQTPKTTAFYTATIPTLSNRFNEIQTSTQPKIQSSTTDAFPTATIGPILVTTHSTGSSTLFSGQSTTSTPSTPASFADDDRFSSTLTGTRSTETVTATTSSPQTSSTGFAQQSQTPWGFGQVTHRPSSAGPTYLPTPVSTATTTERPASSGGPTYLPKENSFATTQPTNVADHVRDMMKTLEELKKQNADEKSKIVASRPGLEIPPSSGPETLQVLANYFATTDESSSSTDQPTTKVASAISVEVDSNTEISSTLVSNKTKESYESLFGLASSPKPTEPTLALDLKVRFAETTGGESSTISLLKDQAGKPETRKIAQVFTNALTAYLEDPDQFRKALSDVRPTVPPNALDNEITASSKKDFDHGSAATYLPTPAYSVATTASTLRTTENLEIFDDSDGTRASSIEITTYSPIRKQSKVNLTASFVDRVPASKLIATNGSGEQVTTEPDPFAMEINAGLGLSTVVPHLNLAESINARKSNIQESIITRFGTEHKDSKVPDALLLDLAPPKSTLSSSAAQSAANAEESGELFHKQQTQSFVPSANVLITSRGGSNDLAHSSSVVTKAPKSSTKKPSGHYITMKMSDKLVSPTTRTPKRLQSPTPSPWQAITYSDDFLDPLTINDGLMGPASNEFYPTTATAFTYLPKGSTTTEKIPIRFNLGGNIDQLIKGKDLSQKTSRIGELISEESGHVLPPANGMQKMANQMFGGLNDTEADHLMHVMQKADENKTVRRLILLLIQTCDDDYSKTVEQSRQALLNALIGMDGQVDSEEEIEVIKIGPHRRGKSIDSVQSSNFIGEESKSVRASVAIPSSENMSAEVTTLSPATTNDSIESVQSTTQLSSLINEETTRFEIRVEDPEEDLKSGTTTHSPPSSDESMSTTITPSSWEETTLSPTLNLSVDQKATPKESSKRKAKDLESSLGQPTDGYSHKNSDTRALELLKSLYSLASKFGKR